MSNRGYEDQAVELAREVNRHFNFLQNHPLPDEPETMLEELNRCNTLLARVGYLIGLTEQIRAVKLSEAYEAKLQQGLDPNLFTPTALKKIIEGEVADYTKLVLQTEKLYSVLFQRVESLRTKISYLKHIKPSPDGV